MGQTPLPWQRSQFFQTNPLRHSVHAVSTFLSPLQRGQIPKRPAPEHWSHGTVTWRVPLHVGQTAAPDCPQT